MSCPLFRTTYQLPWQVLEDNIVLLQFPRHIGDSISLKCYAKIEDEKTNFIYQLLPLMRLLH